MYNINRASHSVWVRLQLHKSIDRLVKTSSNFLLTPNPHDSFTDVVQHFTTPFVYLTTQDSTESCQQILQWPLEPISVSYSCSSDKDTANSTDSGAFLPFIICTGELIQHLLCVCCMFLINQSSEGWTCCIQLNFIATIGEIS